VRLAPTAAGYPQEFTGRCHFVVLVHALQGRFLDRSIGGLQVVTSGSFKLVPESSTHDIIVALNVL
jgi:hypothetical protein